MSRVQIVIPTESLTLILAGNVFSEFVEGDYIKLNFPNQLTDRANGAGDSFLVTERVDSNVGELEISILRGSNNDIILNGLFNRKPIVIFEGSMSQDYITGGTSDITGSNDISDISLENWTLEGGTLTTQPTHTKNNVSHEFSIVYTIQFRNASRLI